MRMLTSTIVPFSVTIRELKQLRRRPQRRLQKSNRFNDQNNSSARASRFLVHFFDVHCTTTTWNLLIAVSWRTWTCDDKFSFLFLNLNKILKNSTPGKVACIWYFEWVQIERLSLKERELIFSPTFSLPSSSSLLRGWGGGYSPFPNKNGYRGRGSSFGEQLARIVWSLCTFYSFTSEEREVKDSRRSRMSQSCFFRNTIRHDSRFGYLT